MKRSLPFIVTAALLASSLAASSTGAAMVLINDTFETYTLNTAPTAPGDGNTHQWTASGGVAPLVISGTSPGGVAPNEKVLNLKTPVQETGGTFGRSFERVVGDAGSEGSLTLSFKLNIGSFDKSDYRITLLDSTIATNNLPINIRIAANGSVIVSARTAPPGSVGTITSVNNPLNNKPLAAGTWYEFTIDVNLQMQTFNLSITNLDAPGITGSTGDLYFIRDVRSLDRFEIAPNSTTAATALDWRLDDIYATTTIPEAGTTASVVLGGLAIGACLRVSHQRRTVHMKD